tara:strand:+ start:3346 stop:4887 length:1542 start_codon:yes stop_codon:yes gene_type:complete
MTPQELKDLYLDGDFRLKGEFQGSDHSREETLTRCERYAGWTLPNIFPDDPLMEYDEMQNDYQSVGAQAVTNLANKIMMALFQPSRPFFRLKLTQKQRESLGGGLSPAQVDVALGEAERAAMHELDKINARVVMTQVVQHLIITGNALLWMPKEGKMQMYSLRDYTVKRDLSGNAIKIIMRETKSVSGLPDDLRAAAIAQGYEDDSDVAIYTCVTKTADDQYVSWQEMEAVCYCAKQIGIYSKSDLPWIPLTWNLCRNKDYGTGLVENYSGDFWTLSTLAEAILDYTTLITDVKNLVNPAGMTDVREITEARSGAYVHGREEDIYVHAPQVAQSSQFLTEQFSAVERRIGAAFLLNTAVTRDAERVTAEEIRMQAQELESSLGGVYSNLATELQLPLATRLLAKINPLFAGIEPVIVTGLESLSRNSELDRIRQFFQDLLALADVPEQVSKRLDYGELIAVLGAGHGVDYKKFLKDEDKVKQDEKALAERNAATQGLEAQAVTQGQATGQPNV